MRQPKQSEISLAVQQNEQIKPVDTYVVGNGDNESSLLKVKFAFKAMAFCASVITLSWFFEGWRRIHTAVDFGSTILAISILAAGVGLTGLLIIVQAFWIYAEEKQKGSLLRRVDLFEKLYNFLAQRKRTVGINNKKGEKTKHA